tara:strand:+ start:3978 stop:4217 length:240 start_codon:yes stop_codon:yes gene_type:complete
MKIKKIVIALLLALPGLSMAADATESFFEFTEAPAATSTSLLEEHGELLTVRHKHIGKSEPKGSGQVFMLLTQYRCPRA